MLRLVWLFRRFEVSRARRLSLPVARVRADAEPARLGSVEGRNRDRKETHGRGGLPGAEKTLIVPTTFGIVQRRGRGQRRASAHDDDRTRRVLGDLFAHRSEKEPREPTAAT